MLLMHKGAVVAVLISLQVFVIIIEGGLVQNFDDNEQLASDENENSCSKKEIIDREKTIKVLNSVLERKMRELEKLEARRQKLLKLLRKLCKESKKRLKSLSDGRVMNKIFIQFFGDKIKSPDGRLLMSKDNEQLQLIGKITQDIYEKEKAAVAKTANAETFDNNPLKIDFDKLKWSDVFRPHENIDFSKITKDELEIILREVLEISKCPLGKVYDAKKQICVPVVHEGQLIVNNTGIFTIDNVFNASLIRTDKTPNDDKLVNKDENSLSAKKAAVVDDDKKKKKISLLKVVEDKANGNTLTSQSIKVDFKNKEDQGGLDINGAIDMEKLLKYAQLKKENQPENDISTGSEGPSMTEITSKIREVTESSGLPELSQKVLKNLEINPASKEGQEIKIQELTKHVDKEIEGVGRGKIDLSQNVDLKKELKVPEISINAASNKVPSNTEGKSDQGLSINISGDNQLNLKPELIKNEISKDSLSSGLSLISQNLRGESVNENGGHSEVEVPSSTGSLTMTPISVSGNKENMQELIAKIMKLVKSGKTNDIAELLKGSQGKLTVKSVSEEASEGVSQTTENAATIHITDEGEIPIATRENGKAKIEFTTDFNATNPEVKIERMPSKIILRATLPNGEVVKVGERNFSNEALLNSNGTLTLDKLGLDLKNISMSNLMRESLNNLKLDVKSEKPTEVKIETKKIQPAKFVQKVHFEKRAGPAATAKDETTSAQSATTAAISSTTEAPTKTTGGPEIFSNIFKPMKEAMKKNKDKITRLLGLNDQDQRRFMDIPASNKEDIDKILTEKPATIEFKSVIGKTLADVPLGKLHDESEAKSTTVASEVSTNSQVIQSSNNPPLKGT